MLQLEKILTGLITFPAIISLVGGGGKTTTMFTLADFFKRQGRNVAVTTTTHIIDPRYENNKVFDRVITSFDLTDTDGISVFGSGITQDNKLTALSFEQINKLKTTFDLTLVEADGAKRLSIKAPAKHEPVIPETSDIVIGVIGLDCLNKPINENNVHRPELFIKITNSNYDDLIHPKHILSLINHKQGLFKNTPLNAKKIVLLNKENLADDSDKNMIADNLKNKSVIPLFL